MKIKRALEEVAAEAQKDGYGFEYMRNIRDGSLEMRIFKGRFGERVTLPVREVVEHETSGTGHKLIFDTSHQDPIRQRRWERCRWTVTSSNDSRW